MRGKKEWKHKTPAAMMWERAAAHLSSRSPPSSPHLILSCVWVKAASTGTLQLWKCLSYLIQLLKRANKDTHLMQQLIIIMTDFKLQ